MNDDYTEALEAIVAQLDDLAEQLAELALDDLKSSLRRGAGRTSAAERRITQARRAVEKAAHLLRSAGDGAVDDEAIE